MGKIITIIGKEIREALPATIFFLILFHLIGFSKAVVLDEFNFTALRSVSATVGALLVAKAVLVVGALPLAHHFSGRRISNILWKTLLYGLVALLFRFLEELIPHASKQGDLVSGIKALIGAISWPLFGVLALWTILGLFFYTLVSDLVAVVGSNKVKDALFSRTENRNGPAGHG